MRVGILGGTFNPPHLAHLVCAQEAHARLGLDRVVLLPAHIPPHKEAEDDPGAAHRLAMCERAVAGDDRLVVSRLELDRAGPSYTVDTLRVLHDREPESDLTFIVGGDMAMSLPDWREPEQVLVLARLGVVERAGASREQIAERLASLGGRGRVDFFSMPRIDISSTDLRERVARRAPVRYLVPDGVVAYVAEHGLYRERA
jgi:nicotinate-nucleotide adenylyltransferase